MGGLHFWGTRYLKPWANPGALGSNNAARHGRGDQYLPIVPKGVEGFALGEYRAADGLRSTLFGCSWDCPFRLAESIL